MMQVLMTSDSAHPDQKHFLFTAHIVRVIDVLGSGCVVCMLDGTKYTFKNAALEVVNLVTGVEDAELDEFLNTPPGTETEQ